MSQYLIFQAGKTAFSMIKDSGLDPNSITAMTGPAGGPKWLIMNHIDKAMFSSWLNGRKKPLFLIGSSSGAWRFAAVSQNDPMAAIDRFQEAYIHQYYSSKPSPHDVSREGLRIQNEVLGRNGIDEILTHPFLRLNVMTVRCKKLTQREEPLLQGAGLAAAAGLNLIRRQWLGYFFERALFYDPRTLPPVSDHPEFPLQKIALNPNNLKSALLASGSIPMVMRGIRDIAGARPGMYRDGGVIDYHADIPFQKHDGIVLFPHYTNRLIPGWLDKKLHWRAPMHADQTLMVSPSPEFLEKLPYCKIPDRTDFKQFVGNDRERVAYWYKACELGRYLADEFMETVLSGKIRERIRI